MSKTEQDEGPTGVTLAAWGDTHCGSHVGIQKPRQYQFAGGNVASTPERRSLYRKWKEYAQRVAEKREGRRLVTVLMGDLIDGVHHGSRQLLTSYLHEQRQMFLDLAWEYLDIVGHTDEDFIYVLRGTDIRDTHGTPSDAYEIARELGAVPSREPKLDRFDLDEYGQPRQVGGEWAWPEIELDIYGNLVQLTHHAPTGRGTRAHTLGNTMRSWARSLQHLKDARRERIPRYVVWAHKHTAHSETVQFENGSAEGPLTTVVCTPAFQGRTEWVKQAIPLTLPTSIGGWWANFDPDGTTVSKLEYTELRLTRKAEKIA